MEFYFVQKQTLQLKQALISKNLMDSKRLSNRFTEEAMLHYDETLGKFGILAYSFYNMFTKTHFELTKEWMTLEKTILQEFSLIVDACDKKDEQKIKSSISKCIDLIYSYDKAHSRFDRTVIDTAKVKLAAKAYGLGLSMDSASQLFNANKIWLQEYVGVTKEDPFGGKLKIEDRLKYLE
jgi:hypothetical protein